MPQQPHCNHCDASMGVPLVGGRKLGLVLLKAFFFGPYQKAFWESFVICCGLLEKNQVDHC